MLALLVPGVGMGGGDGAVTVVTSTNHAHRHRGHRDPTITPTTGGIGLAMWGFLRGLRFG